MGIELEPVCHVIRYSARHVVPKEANTDHVYFRIKGSEKLARECGYFYGEGEPLQMVLVLPFNTADYFLKELGWEGTSEVTNVGG